MKIYLVDIEDRAPLFCEEEAGSALKFGSEGETKGLTGWFTRKLVNLENTLRSSERGIGPHLHRAWEWLRRRAHRDEPFLRRLRSAASLAVFYPASLGEPVARARWASYLNQNRSRHLFWLIANILVCPFTLLLVPLPGPNVIGFWFLYRSIAHLLALLGVLRARSRRIETTFYPLAELDPEPGETASAWIGRIGNRYGLKCLPEGPEVPSRVPSEPPFKPVTPVLVGLR